MGVIGGIAGGGAKLINLVPILFQVLQQIGPVLAGGNIHIFGRAAPGDPEHRPRQTLSGIGVYFGQQELRLGHILENHGEVVVQGVRLYQHCLYVVLVQKVAIRGLALNDGVIPVALQPVDGDLAVAIRDEISQELLLVPLAALVQLEHSSFQAMTVGGVYLADKQITGDKPVGEGEGSLPVPLDKVGELLHLGVAFCLRTRGGFAFRHHIPGFDLNNGAAGGLGDNGHCPGLHMGDPGVGGGDYRCLGPGVFLVPLGRLHLGDGDSGRVVIILRMRPGKEPRPVVHLPALDGGVGAIRKRHINVKQRAIQTPAILVVLADR